MKRNWNRDNPIHRAFIVQRTNANARGIAFCLSYAEWLEWWGADIKLRGCHSGDLCMCRIGDTGSYEVGNIYKATMAQNKAYAWDKVTGQLPLDFAT